MVEVDPAILVAGSTAIAALVGVVVCMAGRSNSSPAQTKAAAPRKEAKVSNSKKVKEIKTETVEVVEKKEPAPAPKKKARKVEEEAPVLPKPTPLAATPAPAPAPSVEEDKNNNKKAKETPEQRAARLERQKITKQKKAEEAAALTKAEPSPPVPKPTTDSFVTQQSQISDGWAVVEERRKKKPKPVEVKKVAAVVTDDDSASPTATSSFVTEQVMVDAKKIGGIIGPKGSTLHAIQDMHEVKIDTPKDRDSSGPVAVSVTGSADGVAGAIRIIKELNTKGYSKALEGENFNESAISVKYSYLSELIGKNGSCIRAMQDKTGVKISIPPNNDAKTKVRIGLAGTAEGIVEAKSIMSDIMTYFHSEVTHPGVIHQTMDVPERMFNMIIGSRGAEIKHIQNNFKVSVHIPNAESTIKEVLVVGHKSGVDSAVKYIEKIVANLNQEEAKAMSVAETWNEQQSTEDPAEGSEPWMDQYSYNKDQKVSLVSKGGAEVLQKAQATAWKDSTSADGW